MGEEVGHQPRLAGGPLPLERPLESRQRLCDVRAGLVDDFGRPPLDQHFQQIEGPTVHVGLRLLANLGELLDDRIGGGLVADLAEDRRHVLQERIDLARRVADDRVGQTGQQAEVVGLAVELLELPEIVLRTSRTSRRAPRRPAALPCPTPWAFGRLGAATVAASATTGCSIAIPRWSCTTAIIAFSWFSRRPTAMYQSASVRCSAGPSSSAAATASNSAIASASLPCSASR